MGIAAEGVGFIVDGGGLRKDQREFRASLMAAGAYAIIDLFSARRGWGWLPGVA
jgi:hypothetical protein